MVEDQDSLVVVCVDDDGKAWEWRKLTKPNNGKGRRSRTLSQDPSY